MSNTMRKRLKGYLYHNVYIAINVRQAILKAVLNVFVLVQCWNDLAVLCLSHEPKMLHLAF